MKTRTKNGLLMVIISLLISTILGFVFAVIGYSENSILEDILFMTRAMLLYFGLAGMLGGFLMMATSLQDNLCFGFGFAMYYGTVALAHFLNDIVDASEKTRLLIAFVIVSLVCYIIWLKQFKPDDDVKQLPSYDEIVLAEPLMQFNKLVSYTRDQDGDLILEMADGSEYCYYDFPDYVYREMKSHYNTVEFIEKYVKGKYKCEKIS